MAYLRDPVYPTLLHVYKRNEDALTAAMKLRRNLGRAKAELARPWRLPISAAKCRAKELDLPFDLTVKWAKDRWTGRCEMTDKPFVLGSGMKRSPFGPSLDRIVPSEGYVQSNCRFILWGINALKMTGTDEDVLRIALAIVAAAMPES